MGKIKLNDIKDRNIQHLILLLEEYSANVDNDDINRISELLRDHNYIKINDKKLLREFVQACVKIESHNKELSKLCKNIELLIERL